jgi:general stress protein 26
MSVQTDVEAQSKRALFQVLGEVRAGMLGVKESEQSMQPMTHFVEESQEAIWFVTSLQSDLVRAVGMGGQAEYCVIGEDHRFHASIVGAIEQSQDRPQLERIWSPFVGVWFDGGVDDPDVALLKFTLREAAVWTSTGNPLVYGLELMRAQVQAGHKPDVGEHAVVRFGASS